MIELTAQLGQLESAQLVRRADETEYIFKHALTQETAYQSLLQKQRRAIHTIIAEAYQAIYTHRCRDEFAAILAQHYAEAGDDLKTIEYATLAGDASARVYANAEASDFYTQAIEAGKRAASLPASTLGDLFLKRGRMCELNGQHAQALANYDAMEALARERGDRPMELAALIARATIYSIPSPQFDKTRAKTLSDQALTLARTIGARSAEAKILWNLMLLNSRLSADYAQAIEQGNQAIAIARELDMREQLAYLYNDISLLYIHTGQSEIGTTYNRQARELWLELNNLPMMADNLSYATMMHIHLGQYDQALDASNEAWRISQAIGNMWDASFSQSWICEVHRDQGNIAQALTAMETAIHLAQFGFQAPLASTRADLATLYGDLGQVERGIEIAKLACQAAAKIARVMKIFAISQLAHLHVLNHDLASAETIIADLRTELTSDEINSIYATALFVSEAELALAQHADDMAIQICDRLIDYLRAHRLRQRLSDAFYFQALAFHHQGQVDAAFERLCKARAVAHDLNARWLLWRIFAALADIENARDHREQARTWLGQARELVIYIAEHTPENLRVSFLNLPHVRAVMESQ